MSVEQARLDSLEASLVAERARRAALEEKIAVETARLVVLKRQYAVALRVLEKHLRAIYESDEPDIVAFALGATSFSELLDTYDLLNRIGQQDEQIAGSLDQARRELERTRAATESARRGVARSEALIAARTEAQRETRDRVVASRDALAVAEHAKAGALASVREDRASFVSEADGLAAESAVLGARIAAAQAQAQAAAKAAPVAGAPAAGAPAPNASSGQLGWPVAGPVTSGFGSRWGRVHEGIDIAVGSGRRCMPPLPAP